MGIHNAIAKAYFNAKDRGWDTIYVLLDVHDTIAESNYRDTEVAFYQEALEALREISVLPEVYLVLWTSCHPKDAFRLIKRLRDEGVNVRGFNSTPVENTVTGCFDQKPYFSILIDDKAGFDPKDWPEVRRSFERERSKVFQVTEVA